MRRAQIPGTFMGSIQLATSGGTLEFERIQTTESDTLRITYIDEINTTGFPRIVTDTASVNAAVTPTQHQRQQQRQHQYHASLGQFQHLRPSR